MVHHPRLLGVDTLLLAVAVATLPRKILVEAVVDTTDSPAAVAGVVVVVTVAAEGAVVAMAVAVVAEVRCTWRLGSALRLSANSKFPGHASLAIYIEEPHRRWIGSPMDSNRNRSTE